jgi:hypothetical protein
MKTFTNSLLCPSYSIIAQLGKSIVFLLMLSFGFTACVDQQFDEPPIKDLGNLAANTTIKDLKSKFNGGQVAFKVTENAVIGGVVIADDASGNFFKNIVIQDATGGITVRMNATGLNATFPIGKQVFVSCKDLFLADYNGITQLNGSADNGIEEVLIAQHVFAGKDNTPVTPKKVSIDQLTPDLINTLVQLDGVQFKDGETGVTYADAVGKLSLNRNVTECGGKSIALRSSGYANFSGAKTPTGNGTIVAVYSVFGSTKQLAIRDVNDVKFAGTRCTGNGGGNTGGGNTGGGDPSVPVVELNETFNTQKDNQSVSLSSWINIGVKGTRNWLARAFSNDLYAQATAFGDTNDNMEAWLITPPIDLKENKILSFATAKTFWKHDGLSVWSSSNFDGKNVATATWTPINAPIAGNTAADNTWVPSGDIPLTANGGKIYIGFKYVGDKTTNTTTYRVDNVKVRK